MTTATATTSTIRSPRRRPAARPPTHSASKTIATYDDYRRALAAVEELERTGAPPGLHIALTGFDDVRVRPENDLLHEAQRAVAPAIVASVVFALGAGLVGGLAIAGPLPLVAAVTVGAGLVAALVVGAFRGLRLDVPVAMTRQVPTSYEVRCDTSSSAAAAEHHLAGWWATGIDGAPATPAGRRVAAG